jgi:hypothetical protein
VDIFFDTTVLVAASVQGHPHYAKDNMRALIAEERRERNEDTEK